MENLTPMLEQYWQIKRQYPGAILFFRLGDFYEMFGQDAEVASRILEITLTSREAGKNERIPMCGVPYHAADAYLAKLVEAGYRVAICEQVEDPKLAKGLVKREVIRVVSPGTIIIPEALKEKEPQHLVAVLMGEGGIGLGVADVSTGYFAVTQFSGEEEELQLLEELQRLKPREIIIPEGMGNRGEHGWRWSGRYEALQPLFAGEGEATPMLTPWSPDEFRPERGARLLMEHFGTVSLEGFGCQHLPLATGAGGALLSYLRETQRTSLGHITRLVTYSRGEVMPLDLSTRRNLELVETIRGGQRRGTLLWVLDSTVTAMGGRLLREWVERPLVKKEAIDLRLEAVAELVQKTAERKSLRDLLSHVYDLERLLARVSYGTANARDLLALRDSFRPLPQICQTLAAAQASFLQTLREQLDPLEDLAQEITRTLVDNPPISVKEGGLIRDGFDSEVDQLRLAAREGKQWIASLESRERETTGIKSLKVGFNKVFGYYIEVTRPNLDLVPASYIRKQTLVNAERFITPELKEKESLILGAEERLMEREYELFVALRDHVAAAIPRIQTTARVLAHLDVLQSLAEVAVRNNYSRPEITEDGVIEIVEGRHPVVELMMRDRPFVPNDCLLDHDRHQLLLVTGPNMAGKSTYMRQVALIVLMAQMGSFVPAKKAKIGLVDRVFTRVGAADDLATGQSTFMVEMNEVANILNHATRRSLLILDEIGRGTSTFDGLSIAWAVMEYLHNAPHLGPKTLFATHYHELIPVVEKLPRATNLQVAVVHQGEKVIFLHRIIPGGADRSYGLEVARLAGLPAPVLQRAKEILLDLEKKREGPENTSSAQATAQLPLFSPEHALLQEILRLDLNQMTPLQALNYLAHLQARLQELVPTVLTGKRSG